jgi:nucleoside-diphosphate-sugar epimerase
MGADRTVRPQAPEQEQTMNVFVSGATGVLGRRVVRRLLAEGVPVTALARSAAKAAALAAAGARPLGVSLFDREGLREAVAGHDVVLNLATAIPSGESAGRAAAWVDNDRIRREGSRNLVDAALAAGASRFVQESVAFVYADAGDRVVDESDPVALSATTATAHEAEAEAARFAAEGGDGVALRFGIFYGPDSAHTVDMVRAARAGVALGFGPPSAYRSLVTTDDAARAVIAALVGPSGTYNVVDDHPVTEEEMFAALADALGTGPLAPPAVPTDPTVLGLAEAIRRSLRISNRRFREATGWTPAVPSVWEGFATVAAQLRGTVDVAARG